MHKVFWSSAARLAASSIVVLSVACGGGSLGETTGPKPTDTTQPGPDGTVQRGSISLQLTFDAADAAAASTAGVTLQGLSVSLIRAASTDAPKIGVTDASGAVKFENLLEGRYDAGVTRALTASELARLPANERDGSTFAGGTSVTLSAGQHRSGSAALVRARRGSLVISEVFRVNGPPLAYPWGDYMEVYNNSDTLIYLDGKLLAGTSQNMHDDLLVACSQSLSLRVDASRIWVSHVWQFPGSGAEYPIRPGEGKVIAMDAINHVVASGQSKYQDLSRADFEQLFTDADTDNPFSVNMINLQFPSTGAGHGFAVPVKSSIVLMNNVPRSTWTQTKFVHPDRGEVGVPMYGILSDAVIDIFSTDLSPAYRAELAAVGSFAQPCSPWLTAHLERGVAPLVDYATPLAIRRRSLGVLSNGQEILQRTGNSSRDLEFAEALRRTLKK